MNIHIKHPPSEAPSAQPGNSHKQSGQSMVEYALLLMLVAAGIFLIVSWLGTTVESVFAQINTSFVSSDSADSNVNSGDDTNNNDNNDDDGGDNDNDNDDDDDNNDNDDNDDNDNDDNDNDDDDD